MHKKINVTTPHMGIQFYHLGLAQEGAVGPRRTVNRQDTVLCDNVVEESAGTAQLSKSPSSAATARSRLGALDQSRV